MRATTKEQGFYSQIFKLVLPIVIQNLLSAAVNSADVVMLNYVGQSAISAVSLASNYANVLFMVYYGLGTGATLLCAQYFGKGNMRAIQTVEGIALRFSVIISVIVAGIAFTMPQMMMRLFTDNAELIRIGASYLRVMGVTYLCWGITEIYLAVLRSLGRVTISMAMNMMAFALNVFFNACFIFGLFGFPKLGATGVAIATAMSRVIELIGCVIVSIMSKDIKLDLRYMFIRNKLLFSDFVKLSLPALGNDLSWGVAFSMYSVILGHLGSDAVAANSLVVVVRNIGTVLCFGVASAGGILLGNVMGEGNLEKAKEYASKLLKLTVVAAKITPSRGRMPSLSWSNKSMLFKIVSQRMEMVQVSLLLSSTGESSGSTGAGFPSGTGSVWNLSLPLFGLAACPAEEPLPAAGEAEEGSTPLPGREPAAAESGGKDAEIVLPLSVLLAEERMAEPSSRPASDRPDSAAAGISRFGAGCKKNATASTATTHIIARPISACLVFIKLLIDFICLSAPYLLLSAQRPRGSKEPQGHGLK